MSLQLKLFYLNKEYRDPLTHKVSVDDYYITKLYYQKSDHIVYKGIKRNIILDYKILELL